MSTPCSRAVRVSLAAALFCLTIGIQLATAAEPAASPSDVDLRSAGWWREQAAKFFEAIAETESRSDAYYQLTYECGHAGVLDAATASAAEVTAPYKGIMARTFVAKKYHEQGDDKNAAKLLESASEFA